MDALAALVGRALAGSELQTARAWSLLSVDGMGLRLGLISLEANTFERSLTVWADLGWVVEVFGVAITDTVVRNHQVPSPAAPSFFLNGRRSLQAVCQPCRRHAPPPGRASCCRLGRRLSLPAVATAHEPITVCPSCCCGGHDG